MRSGKHAFGRSDLQQPAEIQHRDAIGEIAYGAEVVGNEQVADLMLHLQVDQQIQNCRLYRYVERRGRFIADHDAGRARKGARNRNTLLHSSRELAGA